MGFWDTVAWACSLCTMLHRVCAVPLRDIALCILSARRCGVARSLALRGIAQFLCTMLVVPLLCDQSVDITIARQCRLALFSTTQHIAQHLRPDDLLSWCLGLDKHIWHPTPVWVDASPSHRRQSAPTAAGRFWFDTDDLSSAIFFWLQRISTQ